MKKLLLVAAVVIFSFAAFSLPQNKLSMAKAFKLPVYKHIVIVIEENKSYDQIIGSKDAPYINSVLRKEGANFTKMFAEEHFSEGNYFWLFSGNNQEVGFYDGTPDKKNNSKYPFMSENLGHQLLQKGLSFAGYSESLPAIGDTVSKAGLYARKHVPWISFGNIPQGSSIKTSTNLQFKQFPTDFNKLPTVSFVIPNLIHDMHNGKPHENVRVGDKWLRENIDKYYQWAKKHNSILIITFDENDDQSHYSGLTDPASTNHDIKNRIPTIIAGAHIRPGDYAEGKGITHVNILRTIEAMYRLNKAGRQQRNAVKYGIPNDYIVKDVFKK